MRLLLISGAVALMCIPGDCRSSGDKTEFTPEPQQRSFLLQEEEPPKNGTSSYVTEDVLRVDFNDSIDIERIKANYERHKLSGDIVKRSTPGPFAEIPEPQRVHYSKRPHMGVFESKNLLNGAQKKEEKLVIVYASSSPDYDGDDNYRLYSDNQQTNETIAKRDTTNEIEKLNEQPKPLEENTDVLEIQSFQLNGTEVADNETTGTVDTTGNRTQQLALDNNSSIYEEYYSTTQDSNYELYDEASGNMSDYDLEEYDSNKDNLEINVNSTDFPEMSTIISTDEAYTTTTSVTNTDDSLVVNFEMTSALPQYEEVVEVGESSPVGIDINFDIGDASVDVSNVGLEKLSEKLNDSESNNVVRGSYNEITTTPISNQISNSAQSSTTKSLPTASTTNTPTRRSTIPRYINDIFGKLSNKPRPFTLPNRSRNLAYFLQTSPSLYKRKIHQAKDTPNKKHVKTDIDNGQELTFMSAITNMGENIALLSDDNEPSQDENYKPVYDLNAQAYHQDQMVNYDDISPENGYFGIQMSRRNDDASTTTEDEESMTTGPSLDNDYLRGITRRADTDENLPDYEEAKTANSAWVGLGEFFRSGQEEEDILSDVLRSRSDDVEEGDDEEGDDVGDDDDDDDEEEEEEEDVADDAYEGIYKKMKHASLDGDVVAMEKRNDEDEPNNLAELGEKLLKKGTVIRSNVFFGEEPKDILKKVKRKKKAKKKKPVKSKVSGYVKNKVGDQFGILNMDSRSDSDLVMNFYNLIERLGQRLGQDVSGGYGMVGPRESYDGVPGVVFLPRGTFAVRTREGASRRSQGEMVTVPVPRMVPVPQPVPVRVLQPVAVTIPVPVPVERTITVPLERRVPVPVEKPVILKIIKQVRVPVIKPYPVPVPVYKTQYIVHSSEEEQPEKSRQET